MQKQAITIQELNDQVDDIVSSGYDWSDWHENALTELFDGSAKWLPITNKLRKEFFKTYYIENDVEGVTEEEVQFMGKLCKMGNTKLRAVMVDE